MKRAPPAHTLQPLPPDAQPAVSQNVQRAATQADIQTIQKSQAVQQNISAGSHAQVLPITVFAPMSSSDSIALWIALIIAAVISAGAAWLWRSF